MKKIEKYIILVISLIAVGAIVAALYFATRTNYSNNNSVYTITYFDNYEPGTTYTIAIDSDYNIILIEQPNCSTLECINGTYYPKATETKVKFSSKGKAKIKKFVDEIFIEKDINSLELYDDIYEDFSEEQKKTYTAIFYNNEDMLFE